MDGAFLCPFKKLFLIPRSWRYFPMLYPKIFIPLSFIVKSATGKYLIVVLILALRSGFLLTLWPTQTVEQCFRHDPNLCSDDNYYY